MLHNCIALLEEVAVDVEHEEMLLNLGKAFIFVILTGFILALMFVAFDELKNYTSADTAYERMQRFCKICASMPESESAVLLSISMDCIWDVICRLHAELSDEEKEKLFKNVIHQTYEEWMSSDRIQEFM